MNQVVKICTASQLIGKEVSRAAVQEYLIMITAKAVKILHYVKSALLADLKKFQVLLETAGRGSAAFPSARLFPPGNLVLVYGLLVSMGH